MSEPSAPPEDSPETLRLAHVSDAEITVLPPLGALRGKRMTGFAAWQILGRWRHSASTRERVSSHLRQSAPDFVVATGDLVTFATEAEFAESRNWLDGLGPASRVAALPGDREALVPGMVRALHEAWGPYIAGEDGAHGFPALRHIGRLALVGLSTAAASVPFLQTGILGSGQLQRLDEILGALAAAGTPAIVALHHPPAGAVPRHRQLYDAAAFRRIVGTHGALAVLHGGVPAPRLDWIEGPHSAIPVIGAPSASTKPRRDGDGGGWNEVRLAQRAGGGWDVMVTAHRITRAGTMDARPLLSHEASAPP